MMARKVVPRTIPSTAASNEDEDDIKALAEWEKGNCVEYAESKEDDDAELLHAVSIIEQQQIQQRAATSSN
jgi:hypothetical protein